MADQSRTACGANEKTVAFGNQKSNNDSIEYGPFSGVDSHNGRDDVLGL